MVTEFDIIRLRAQFGLSDESLDYIANSITQEEIVKNGYQCFIAKPIKAWGETENKLRAVELVSLNGTHATVEVENSLLTIMKNDLLIDVNAR